MNRNMKKRFRPYDWIMQGICWLLSTTSVIVLTIILVFLIKKGFSKINYKLLTDNYNSETLMTEIEDAYPGNFTAPEDLEEGAVFSKRYGIAFRDTLDKHNSPTTQVVYLDPQSPLRQAVVTTAGARQGTLAPPEEDLIIKKFTYKTEMGKTGNTGKKSVETVRDLDERAAQVIGYLGQTKGGGIRGSLVAGFMLIGLTLIIVLPIGIAAAIWLHELAPKNHFTEMIRSGVDMLSGVPSIVFGLMGMTMLYPITQLMGIGGQSIVLGSLTMAVILLPLVIRQTEESLKTVPVSERMGSLSLGASMTQTIMKVVLPQAMPGIITACLLSISRIIGESAALVYTMGTAISDHPTYDRGATTPALMIWKVMSGEQPDFELASAISIVILVVVFMMNIATRIIMNRLSQPKGSGDTVKKEA